MSRLKQETIQQEYVYQGKIVKMRVDQAKMPDGLICDREVVEHPGGVGIALEDTDGTFFFVRQWRYAQACETIEYPAGKREKGEEDLNTAQREIIEETGYEGTDWKYLGEIYPTPAYDAETIGMYYAKKGKFVGQNLDEDEMVDVLKYTVEEMAEKIVKGEIHDSKTIAMTFLILENKKKGII